MKPTMEDRLLEAATIIARALDDQYGVRPPRSVLKLAYGEAVGGALDDIVEIQREMANAHIPGFAFDAETGTYSAEDGCGCPMCQEAGRLVAMGLDTAQAWTVVTDPRYKPPVTHRDDGQCHDECWQVALAEHEAAYATRLSHSFTRMYTPPRRG